MSPPLVAYHLIQLLERLNTIATLLDTLDRFGVLAWLHGTAEHLAAWLLHLPAMLA